MTDRELIQQWMRPGAIVPVDMNTVRILLDALRERLAQPEQEPVAWMYQDKSTHEVRFQKHMRGFVDHGATYETPLYTAPQPRQWVGLTATEVHETEGYEEDRKLYRFARAIEAKLREKNA